MSRLAGTRAPLVLVDVVRFAFVAGPFGRRASRVGRR